MPSLLRMAKSRQRVLPPRYKPKAARSKAAHASLDQEGDAEHAGACLQQ